MISCNVLTVWSLHMLRSSWASCWCRRGRRARRTRGCSPSPWPGRRSGSARSEVRSEWSKHWRYRCCSIAPRNQEVLILLDWEHHPGSEPSRYNYHINLLQDEYKKERLITLPSTNPFKNENLCIQRPEAEHSIICTCWSRESWCDLCWVARL